MAGIGLLHHDHPRVAAQFPRELALADINGKDARRTGLEQAVREPAGAGAEVGGSQAGNFEAEVAESVFEFETAAADVFIRGGQRENVARARCVAGFSGRLTVDGDLSRHDGALRLFATLAQAAVHEFLIQSGHVADRKAHV